MNNHLNYIDPELIVRVLSEEADVHEVQAVKEWIDSNTENKTYYQQLSNLWNASASAGSFKHEWLKEDWIKVRQHINDINVEESIKPSKQRKQVFTFARIAASIVLCIGIYFCVQRFYNHTSVKQTIAIGIESITLPDGSRVYMNDKSKLIYPEKFESEKREVILEGEAFFEITKNLQKPFLIKTGKVTTEVVGTSFNVNSNAGKIVITVLTGKVMLYERRHSFIAMTAGEQGTYSESGLVKKINDDPNFLSWKTHLLVFNDASLTKVIHDLNKYYGKKIKLESDALTGCTLTSSFQDQPLEEILHELEIVFSIHIEKVGNEIIIKGRGC